MERIRLDHRMRTPQSSERAFLPGGPLLHGGPLFPGELEPLAGPVGALAFPKEPNLLLDKGGGGAGEEPWQRAQMAAQRWWETGRWWQRAPGLPEDAAEQREEGGAGAAWKAAAAAAAAAAVGAGVTAGVKGTAGAAGAKGAAGAAGTDLWQRVLSDENFRVRNYNYPYVQGTYVGAPKAAPPNATSRQLMLACDVEDRLIDDLEPEPSLWPYSRLLQREMSRHRRQLLLQRRLQHPEDSAFPPAPKSPVKPPLQIQLHSPLQLQPQHPAPWLSSSPRSPRSPHEHVSGDMKETQKLDVNEYFRRMTPKGLLHRLTTATVAVSPAAATAVPVSHTSSQSSFDSSSPGTPATTTEGGRENAICETRSDPLRFVSLLPLEDSSVRAARERVRLSKMAVRRAPARRATEYPLWRRTYEVSTQCSGPSRYSSETDTREESTLETYTRETDTRETDTSTGSRDVAGCFFVVDSCTSTADGRISTPSTAALDEEYEEYGSSDYRIKKANKRYVSRENLQLARSPRRSRSTCGVNDTRGPQLAIEAAMHATTSALRAAERSCSGVMKSLLPTDPASSQGRMSRWRNVHARARSHSPYTNTSARPLSLSPPRLAIASPPPLALVVSRSGRVLQKSPVELAATAQAPRWVNMSGRSWNSLRRLPVPDDYTVADSELEETEQEERADAVMPITAFRHPVAAGGMMCNRRVVSAATLRYRKHLSSVTLASQRAAAHIAAAEYGRTVRGMFPPFSNVHPPPPPPSMSLSFSAAMPRHGPTGTEVQGTRGVTSVSTIAAAANLCPHDPKRKEELIVALGSSKWLERQHPKWPNMEPSFKTSLLSCATRSADAKPNAMKPEDRMRLYLRAKYQRTVETLKLKMRMAKHREKELERARGRKRAPSSSGGDETLEKGGEGKADAGRGGAVWSALQQKSFAEPPPPPSTPLPRPPTPSSTTTTVASSKTSRGETPSGKGAPAIKSSQGESLIVSTGSHPPALQPEAAAIVAASAAAASAAAAVACANFILPDNPPLSTFAMDDTALRASAKSSEGRRPVRKRRRSKRRVDGLLSLQMAQSPGDGDSSAGEDLSEGSVGAAKAHYSPTETVLLHTSRNRTASLESVVAPRGKEGLEMPTAARLFGMDALHLDIMSDTVSNPAESPPRSRSRNFASPSKGSGEKIVANGDGIETSVGNYCPLTMLDPSQHYPRAELERKSKEFRWICDKTLSAVDARVAGTTLTAMHATTSLKKCSGSRSDLPPKPEGGEGFGDRDLLSMTPQMTIRQLPPILEKNGKAKTRSESPLSDYGLQDQKSVEIIGDVRLSWESCKGLKFRIKTPETTARTRLESNSHRRRRSKDMGSRKRIRPDKSREAKVPSPPRSPPKSEESGSLRDSVQTPEQELAFETWQLDLTTVPEYYTSQKEAVKSMVDVGSVWKQESQTSKSPQPASLSATALPDEEKRIPFCKCNPQASAARRAFRTVMEGVGALVRTPSTNGNAHLPPAHLHTAIRTPHHQELLSGAGDDELRPVPVFGSAIVPATNSYTVVHPALYPTTLPATIPITTLPSLSPKLKITDSTGKSKMGSQEAKLSIRNRSIRVAAGAEAANKTPKPGAHLGDMAAVTIGGEKDAKTSGQSPGAKTEMSNKSLSKIAQEVNSQGPKGGDGGPAVAASASTSSPPPAARRTAAEMLHSTRKSTSTHQQRISADTRKPSVRRDSSVTAATKTAAGPSARRLSQTRRPSPVTLPIGSSAAVPQGRRASPDRTSVNPLASTRTSPRARPTQRKGPAPDVAPRRRCNRRRSSVPPVSKNNAHVSPSTQCKTTPAAAARSQSPNAQTSTAPVSSLPPPRPSAAPASAPPLPARARNRSKIPRKRKKRMPHTSRNSGDAVNRCRFTPPRFKAAASAGTWNCSTTRRTSKIPWNGFSNPGGGATVGNPVSLNRTSPRPRGASCLRKREVANV